MKKYKRLAAALAALFILLNNSPVLASETELLSDETIATQDDSILPDETIAAQDNSVLPDETIVAQDGLVPSDEMTNNPLQNSTDAEVPASLSDNALMTEVSTVQSEEPDMPLPDEAPEFSASIEYSWEGYVVKGTFTEFPADISQIRALYSLDSEIWQECIDEWDLHLLGTENPSALAKLQTQTCLYSNFEPLRSYLEGTLDRFYLKLRLTLKNGSTYESQTAVIDRGAVQPVPEGTTLTASFASSISIIEKNPFRYYGRYQLTVSPTATPEDISAFLPGTLPIKIDLQQGRQYIAGGIIDCPVTWKPLSLPPLTAGESITISDAAEEIVVPSGTLLSTPVGDYRLDESLTFSQDMLSDEVRLVLNVTAGDGNPTGVLSRENNGLEAAFDLKPTGATAIRAYTLSDQDSGWVELPAVPFLDAVNAQPSTANSGYTLVIKSDQEPYRSYLAAETAGDTPTPFMVGLKIEGGVYNGRQLVLTWPDTYELPPNLPKVGGAGGNENNAGSDNIDDSTEEGQRPNLPQNPKETKGSEPSDSAQPSDVNQDTPSTSPAQIPNKNQNAATTSLAQTTNDNQGAASPDSSQTLKEPLAPSASDSSNTNKKQSASPSGITSRGNQQDQKNEPASDGYKDSAQADNPAETSLLAALFSEAVLSASQTGIYGHDTRVSRYELLLLVAATTITIIFLIVITTKVTAKKKNARK